ncbi:MAG TPA: hypothetical protein VGM52_08290 [Herbaspirillum sp.]
MFSRNASLPARPARRVEALPADIETLRVVNDSDLAQGIQRFIFALEKAGQQCW